MMEARRAGSRPANLPRCDRQVSSMRMAFLCPVCERQTQTEVDDSTEVLRCDHCQWSRPIAAGDVTDDIPRKCLCCGCDVLWKQRDFPPKLGLAIVASAAILSSIAWAYMLPVVAIGILMGFGILDFVLYAIMPDVQVCYRCNARFRHPSLPDELPTFNLETAERYRQESLRLEAAKGRPAAKT